MATLTASNKQSHSNKEKDKKKDSDEDTDRDWVWWSDCTEIFYKLYNRSHNPNYNNIGIYKKRAQSQQIYTNAEINKMPRLQTNGRLNRSQRSRHHVQAICYASLPQYYSTGWSHEWIKFEIFACWTWYGQGQD